MKVVFSVWFSILVGSVSVGVLLILIISEGSVQPYGPSRWRKTEMPSPVLSAGVHLIQEFELDEVLIKRAGLLEVFFGDNGVDCVGQIEVVLEQGDVEIATGMRTEGIEKTTELRLDLSGLNPGMIRIHFLGIEGDEYFSPALWCRTEGISRELEGTELDEPLEAQIFLYQEIRGRDKFKTQITNDFIGWIGLLSVTGIVSLAWFAMGKTIIGEWGTIQ